MKKYLRALSKYEVYFFYAITLATLLPVLLYKTFPTVDGPAHLYNARLIHELLIDNTDYLPTFFEFNRSLVPNWLGHLILSSLLFFLPALMAEKVLLAIYIILFPISFRFLWKGLSIDGLTGSFALYFVFPFSYSFLFYYGFYNFHLGMVLLFFTVGFWIKYSKSSQIESKQLAFLILLTLLIYFSHVFVFAIFVGVIGFISLIDFLKSPRLDFLKSLKSRFLLIAPGCILTIFYLINTTISPENSGNVANLLESWSMIQSVEPARAIEYGKEGVFTKWIFILLVVILGNLFFVRLKHFKASLRQNSMVWGGISLGLLIVFFLVPNGPTFIKSRLLVFFFLFLILFISTQKVNVWVRVISFVLINYVNIALLKIYIESTKSANAITAEIIEASQHIEPYSTVLPIDDSGHWLLSHSSNYLGVNKPLVILENYEAKTDYFPLIWNYSSLPHLHLGDTDRSPLDFPTNKANTQSQIDYIFIMSGTDVSENRKKSETGIKDILDQYYRLTFTSGRKNIKVYKRVSSNSSTSRADKVPDKFILALSNAHTYCL
ncbi:hypothetical protein O3Q51_11725 [Cryomorphaceae bacterium 1068]|nr:hypothetical protein [Cryomorphaceae bacterium 1068]